MRYIANSEGILQHVSFGADISCDGKTCKQYLGHVPAGYSSMEDWYQREWDKLYRWKALTNRTTLIMVENAQEPAEYGIEYGTWQAATNGGTITAQKCTFMKVGNMCSISFMIEGTGSTGTSLYLAVTGVPYAPADGARWYGGGGHAQGLRLDTGHSFTGFILQPNGALYARTENSGTAGYCYITNGGAAFYMAGSITYPIA